MTYPTMRSSEGFRLDSLKIEEQKMLRYLINGVREEVSNRLGKLVRSDAFANAVGEYDQFRVPELDICSFDYHRRSRAYGTLPRRSRSHDRARGFGAGGIGHIVGADHF